MDKELFRAEVVGLYEYFRYKIRPDNVVIERWYQKLKALNNAALKQAVRELENLDSLPRNVPKAIKEAWERFLLNNPSKADEPEVVQDKCPDCNSTGLFLIRAFNPQSQRFHDQLVLCGSCRNWQRWFDDFALSRLTAQALQARGVKYASYNVVAHWLKEG